MLFLTAVRCSGLIGTLLMQPCSSKLSWLVLLSLNLLLLLLLLLCIGQDVTQRAALVSRALGVQAGVALAAALQGSSAWWHRGHTTCSLLHRASS